MYHAWNVMTYAHHPGPCVEAAPHPPPLSQNLGSPALPSPGPAALSQPGSSLSPSPSPHPPQQGSLKNNTTLRNSLENYYITGCWTISIFEVLWASVSLMPLRYVHLYESPFSLKYLLKIQSQLYKFTFHCCVHVLDSIFGSSLFTLFV